MRGAVEKRGKTWTVRYDEPGETGRRQRRKGGFGTRREAQRFLNDTLARVGDGSYVAPAKQTVAQYLAEWLPAARTTVKPQTGERYEQLIRRQVVPHIGHIRLQALTGGHLTALYAQLGEEYAASTVRGVHTVLGRALSDAVREGKLLRNVAKLARAPRRTPSRATVWTTGELNRFP